jgi:hypothetical protein
MRVEKKKKEELVGWLLCMSTGTCRTCIRTCIRTCMRAVCEEVHIYIIVRVRIVQNVRDVCEEVSRVPFRFDGLGWG